MTTRVLSAFTRWAANNARQSSQGAQAPREGLSGHTISPLKRPGLPADSTHKRGLHWLPAPLCRPGSKAGTCPCASQASILCLPVRTCLPMHLTSLLPSAWITPRESPLFHSPSETGPGTSKGCPAMPKEHLSAGGDNWGVGVQLSLLLPAHKP